MKWFRRAWAWVCLADLSARIGEHVDQTEAIKAKVSEFAGEIQSFGIDQQIVELAERINKLEELLLPLRNGRVTRTGA